MGDVRGALGISFPATQINIPTNRLMLRSNRIHIIAFITVALSSTIILSLFAVLSRRLKYSNLKQQQLESQIQYYPLTGVLSRSAVLNHLHREFNRSVRHDNPLTVLMLDIDHFKKVNDTYGHRSGDVVLKAFAKLASMQLRSIDHIGRFGGEEFIVLLTETTLASATLVADRIRHAIEQCHIDREQHHSINITVSIGLAERKQDRYLEQGALIELADQTLYQAKNNGRNCISTTVPPPP